MPESEESGPPIADDGDRSSRRWRRRRRFLIGTLAAVSILVVVFRNPLFRGNFAVVDPGTVFRSAQPGADLRERVAANGLASILNLRGGSLDDRYYADELAVADRMGVEFYDFPMSAVRRPTRRELLVLIDFFEHCRYPLLIHCKSGSDRTGLASALYVMTRTAKPPTEAMQAFSLYFGHVPLGGTGHLHEPFLEYDRWLKDHHLVHSPQLLREWVEREYESPGRVVPFRRLQAGPRARLERRAAR